MKGNNDGDSFARGSSLTPKRLKTERKVTTEAPFRNASRAVSLRSRSEGKGGCFVTKGRFEWTVRREEPRRAEVQVLDWVDQGPIAPSTVYFVHSSSVPQNQACGAWAEHRPDVFPS